MAKRLSPLDASFLYGESSSTMMHIGGLNHFVLPEDAGPSFLRDIVDEMKSAVNVAPPWNYSLKTPGFLKNPVHYWHEQDQIDLEYHVRRSALPAPGDERELGILISRLHSHSLDFHRPPWELHMIEGLERNRFALYTKMHHSLIDGVTGSKMMARSLSTDPDDRNTPLFFTRRPPKRDTKVAARVPSFSTVAMDALKLMRDQVGAGKDVARAMLSVAQAVRGRDDLVIPFRGPNSILNGRITRSRRFATQQMDVPRLKALAKKAGASINDVILALSSTALRRYLIDANALPDKPLITMIPVNVRPKDDPGGGNAVGVMLASLATDVADPEARLQAILDSTRRAKKHLQGMSRQAIMQYSMLIMTPFGLQLLTGTSGRMRPAYNLVISNVPGPEKTLYFRGARMEAAYPLSIPLHGQAFNITCHSYADTMNFGFVGCREAVPHMQRIAVYTGEALDELEKVVG